ncbi:MAG: 2-C-methyl-D-erythritol 4-phosphate cytidylyltransferase [Clostridiales Family XIII bacterium]|jgi:2-C-methyl-D-erythritol 4-phosphate cytidylyltransferase|nr:2-C-methyl-D-erythritol 4-phosphate cytidylyltransferase [Clostridiales Family XIII bacterium]
MTKIKELRGCKVNAGLILSGGKGERLASDIPKQYIEIGGKLIINYALKAFENCAGIDIICVVVAAEYRSLLHGECEYVFAEPGETRQRSIWNGLEALRAHAPEYVIIHDAARPNVTAGDVTGVIGAAENYDGATPALAVTDTVYLSVDGKTITKTLHRDALFAGQTPECYDFEKYRAAHVRFADRLDTFRGSSEIAVAAGMRIALAKGRPGNFKITADTDLERFRAIVEGGSI